MNSREKLSTLVPEMNIHELPDDCLLNIFNIFNKFGTLLNCARVCQRWEDLVLERLKNVKYLTSSTRRYGYPASYTIFFKDDDQIEQLQLLEWFPKLKIFGSEGAEDANFISNLQVKGLQLTHYYVDLDTVGCNNHSLEMLAVSAYSDFFANNIQGPRLTQLYISSSQVSMFAEYARYFPNLKRLHLHYFSRYPLDDTFYTGPVLEKLEILEMCFHVEWSQDDYFGFSLADHCPALKSAYHFIQADAPFFINSEIKNHFLENLVLEFDSGHSWSTLRRILVKYPSLKHLAIRGDCDTSVSDRDIPELLNLLPQIVLIEIRNSSKVTEKSTEYIDRYCKEHDRVISFYYEKRPKITKKWPHLLTKSVIIGRGFDFMKYCFLRKFNDLPPLLDPDEQSSLEESLTL